MSKAPFEEILVAADSKDPEAIAARKRLQAALDQLNPAGGKLDDGDGSGRHTNKSKKKQIDPDNENIDETDGAEKKINKKMKKLKLSK